MHAFIVIHARPHIHGERLKEFTHRPDIEPGLYIWQNRGLTLADHNEVARKVVEQYQTFRPYTRMLPVADPKTAELEGVVALRNAEISSLRDDLARTKEALTASLKKPRPNR